MIGRDVMPKCSQGIASLGEPVVEFKSVHCQSDRGVEALQGVSFEVRGGEIFGIAGVEGNGQSELVEVLTGLRPMTIGARSLSIPKARHERFDRSLLTKEGP